VSSGTVAAVDLGASSGRVVVGQVGPGELRLVEVHRFANEPVTRDDGLHWDTAMLRREVIEGLRRAATAAPDLRSVGVDGWGVDYGLLHADGELVDEPSHYRDARTADGVEAVHARIDRTELYARNGLQFLPFNTLYQLAADRSVDARRDARTMLLMPDLVGFWLSGMAVTERTNASTTGLLDPASREWAWDLIDRLGFTRELFVALGDAGDVLGQISTDVGVAADLGEDVVVTLVGSHDTASAVVGVPMEDDRSAFVSCGTWSLVGVELDRPILTDASRAANFTNEGGVDGTVRFLRNVAGLWLFQESLRAWESAGTPEDLAALLDAAAALPNGGPLIDPDDPDFLPPGDMPARIEAACTRTGQPVPSSRAALARCILDSLAAAYARAIDDAARLSGRDIRTIHLVGGGANNELLCRLTADACGRPVVAGPVEATAIGNILVQARTHGFVSGGLVSLRALVRATQPLRRFEPTVRSAGPIARHA
jgi:rhamnulokinase